MSHGELFSWDQLYCPALLVHPALPQAVEPKQDRATGQSKSQTGWHAVALGASSHEQMLMWAYQPLVDGAWVPVIVVAHLAIRTSGLHEADQGNSGTTFPEHPHKLPSLNQLHVRCPVLLLRRLLLG
jgi:hypothetical protein